MPLPPIRPLLAATALLALGSAAQATENQSLRALLGAPGQEMTLPQLPGVYGQLWLQRYSADTFRNSDGDAQSAPVGHGVTAVRGGRIDALAVVPRLTWVSESRLGEGRLGVSATLPFVKIQARTQLTGLFPAAFTPAMRANGQAGLDARAAGMSDTLDGLGDMEIAPFVDFQDDESRLVLLAALVLPTGSYDAARAVNTGSGDFYTLRPGLLWGRAWENGLEFGTRATYSFNTVNDATRVRSGQYLHVDASLLYRLNDQWRVGVAGYALRQFTKDTGPGVAADGNKAQTYAIGPSVGFSSLDGSWGLEAKYLPEFHVRNRPDGSTAWLRLMMRVD